MATAERVAAALAEPVEVEGAEFHVSASLGVSLFPRLAIGGEELLRQADTAMYQAKRAGRSGHMVYTPEEQHPLDRLSLTARLRRSIERNELELHYQPIYSLDSGQPAAVEALLRWNDPSRGLVPPAAFIPAAEHSGLIEPIGDLGDRRAVPAGRRVGASRPHAAPERERRATGAAQAGVRGPARARPSSDTASSRRAWSWR